MSNKTIRIAIDCMGGEHGFPVTLPAAVKFAQEHSDSHCLLVGDQTRIEAQLRALPQIGRDWFTIVHTDEVVDMDDSVEVALRRKRKSSMRLAAQAVKGEKADACISDGRYGELVAISRYELET